MELNISTQSQEIYQAIIKNMAEAVIVIDLETRRLVDWNPASQQLLGYSNQEMSQLTIYDYIGHDKVDIEEKINAVLTQREHFHGERIYRRKDGRKIEVEVSATLITYSGRQEICIVCKDISDQKEAERALLESKQELRRLSSHLMTTEESLKRRISLELHDQLGPDLMVMKFMVQHVWNKLRKDQSKLKGDCEILLDELDSMVENIRRISHDLSPTILEDAGLSDSLRWLSEDLIQEPDSKIEIDFPELNGIFSRDACIMIYRIFGEALTNISKHAKAENVRLTAEKQTNSVHFTIKDNGKGFDLRQVLRKEGGRCFGLTAINERVRTLGGTIDIWSSPGMGTMISFFIPNSE